MRGSKCSWGIAAVAALSVICITFGVLIATGRIKIGSNAPPPATDGERDDRYASVDTDGVRAELEAIGLGDVPEHVVATLSTLEKLDDYPVYTMRYFGPYIRASELRSETDREASGMTTDWACSLFAAVGSPSRPVLGRNFDWEVSPILVLLLEPEEGHRSMMSIDIAYLVEPEIVGRLEECGIEQLLPLLDAPFLTFDGMNEAGLAVGMAAVDYECGYPSNPDNRNVGDLRLMREVLEASSTVEEAIAFLVGINPVSQGGPNMHYLIADRTPDAALIEYRDGEMVVFRSNVKTPWQLGTNFPVVLTDGDPAGRCWRYDLIEKTLRESGGDLSATAAMSLLEDVSTPTTRWSIVYDLTETVMHLCVGRNWDLVHEIPLVEDVESEV